MQEGGVDTAAGEGEALQRERDTLRHELSLRLKVLLGKSITVTERINAEIAQQAAALETYRKAEQRGYAGPGKRRAQRAAKAARHTAAVQPSGADSSIEVAEEEGGASSESEEEEDGNEGRGDPAKQARRLRAAALADVA